MTESRVADTPAATVVEDQVEQADGARVNVRPSIEVIVSPGGPDGRPPPATMDMRQRLQQVLAGQRLPAKRWELFVTAEVYGADLVTPSELHALVPVRFQCLADVLLAVEQTRRVCRWLER